MNLLKRIAVPIACAMTVLAMTACSSTKDERRNPVPLTEFKPVFNVERAWKASLGKAGRYFFSPVVVGEAVYAAGSNGTVATARQVCFAEQITRSKPGVPGSAVPHMP